MGVGEFVDVNAEACRGLQRPEGGSMSPGAVVMVAGWL